MSAGGRRPSFEGKYIEDNGVSISWRVVPFCRRAVPVIQGVTHINCKAFRCLSLHHICGRSRTPLVYRRGRHFVGQAERGAMAPMALPWIRHCRYALLIPESRNFYFRDPGIPGSRSCNKRLEERLPNARFLLFLP